MKLTIYIESEWEKDENGRKYYVPIGDWGLLAYDGYKQRPDTDVILFNNIDDVPYSKTNIIVACIESTNIYLEKCGIKIKALNIPEELMKYAGRDIQYMAMAEFRKDMRCPIFVKPNGRAKEFISGVLTSLSTKDLLLNDVPDEEECFVSEIVDFVSEYRGYVIKGKLVGIKHYLGDFRVFPDMKIVDSAVKDYISAPEGYSIDFGVTSDGRTLLVECNDGWSLGNYGLETKLYCKLLTSRWMEIMKDSQYFTELYKKSRFNRE